MFIITMEVEIADYQMLARYSLQVAKQFTEFFTEYIRENSRLTEELSLHHVSVRAKQVLFCDKLKDGRFLIIDGSGIQESTLHIL